MRAAIQRSSIRLTLALLVACAASACNLFKSNAVEVNGETTTSFSIAPGQEIEIFLQTIGSGEFGAPPALNGSAIAFLEVTSGGLNDPGGPTQLFHFRGMESGTTIITFHHVCGGAFCVAVAGNSVTDTVTVR